MIIEQLHKHQRVFPNIFPRKIPTSGAVPKRGTAYGAIFRKEVLHMGKMTDKQRRFCDEYLVDLNATQAAIRAGYSEKYANTNASKLLQITTIKEYIAERMAEKEDQLIAKQDEIMKYFTAVMRGESRSHVLARTAEGAEEVIEKPPDEKERLKAAENLAKRYGLDTEEIERQARLEKLKAETARIKGESPDDDNPDDGFMEAMRGETESVWQE